MRAIDPEDVLRLSDVSKTYPGTPPIHALAEVSLRVRRDELLAVVGPSGSGKSTLLHIMGTLDRPSSGTVAVAGYEVSGLSDRSLSALRSRHVGFVFQRFYLLSGESALENVADGLLYTGVSRRERRRMAAEALDRVGLGNRLHQSAGKLSGGEAQRVAIARAVVGRPAIVLADEPTGNLDTRTGESIVELLEDLNSQGTTIVVITHDTEIAEHFPRQVGLRDGKIEYDTAGLGVG